MPSAQTPITSPPPKSFEEKWFETAKKLMVVGSGVPEPPQRWEARKVKKTSKSPNMLYPLHDAISDPADTNIYWSGPDRFRIVHRPQFAGRVVALDTILKGGSKNGTRWSTPPSSLHPLHTQNAHSKHSASASPEFRSWTSTVSLIPERLPSTAETMHHDSDFRTHLRAVKALHNQELALSRDNAALRAPAPPRLSCVKAGFGRASGSDSRSVKVLKYIFDVIVDQEGSGLHEELRTVASRPRGRGFVLVDAARYKPGRRDPVRAPRGEPPGDPQRDDAHAQPPAYDPAQRSIPQWNIRGDWKTFVSYLSEWQFRSTGTKVKGGAEYSHPSGNFHSGRPKRLQYLVSVRNKAKSAPARPSAARSDAGQTEYVNLTMSSDDDEAPDESDDDEAGPSFPVQRSLYIISDDEDDDDEPGASSLDITKRPRVIADPDDDDDDDDDKSAPGPSIVAPKRRRVVLDPDEDESNDYNVGSSSSRPPTWDVSNASSSSSGTTAQWECARCQAQNSAVNVFCHQCTFDRNSGYTKPTAPWSCVHCETRNPAAFVICQQCLEYA
ncbi:uncharacterized protein EHS24_000658 [Apiotrichum porosum]|uniref:RanBP2-type domain-containing protein n=1 Tax=Apiotrichum porosum TaxID=105984 RepID=A0A427YAE6_9TREE|nr:uncharacterized protein EHS24_000658 [Apiotrichum porosum]RSH88131.1 hypothetical protein EHS24_000658 [Apiotrichum porosum]